ncbi:hypothetical protein GCM10027413_12160 [Conyzicola nivalis]|uniref:Fido domain-containing protein n=1 Tax=Conyzicola nivalis TaxID=1477021 RepID=A0A916SHY0_9MICO|nr:hypothetical protein [Conyzicola nivalis]GGB01052.1 hypothetical protein GCM10010979_14470 [Conyzicola nivalis]
MLLTPANIASTLEPATLELSGDAALALENFRAEFTADDAAFAPTFARAEGAASAALAGFEADARQTGLARLGLAAPADARNAASVLAATLVALVGGDLGAVHDAIDPGDDVPDGLELDGRTLLVPAALDHAWLVARRPFFLGNARVARAIHAARLSTPVVPLPISGGWLADDTGYRTALAAYERGDANPMVLAQAHAVHAAIDNARQLATALAITRDDWDQRMVGVRSHASSRELVAVAFEHPVIDAKLAVSALGVTLAAAYTSIETLVERGILVSRGPERRNRAWFAPGILDAVDAFVDRARG